jgi:O-antigen/teichoic acid export membrane protein
VLIVACVFLFVHSEEDLWIYTLIMSACFLLEQLLLFVFIFRYVHWVRVSWAEIAVHFIPNFKLFIPLAALSVYNWMDKLMLGAMAGNEPVAYYTYAESIINLPKGIVAALGTVMLPRISKLVAQKKVDSCLESLRDSMNLICFVCCALCFGIAGVAPVFVPFFLGPEYTRTVSLTIGLALVMIPMSVIDVIQSQYLVPFGKDKVYIQSVSLGAAVNLLLNALFIPAFGAAGAVIGTIGAELAVWGAQMYSIRNIYRLRELGRSLWPFFLSGMIEFAVTYHLGRLSLKPLPLLILQVGVGGVVYLVCCILIIEIWRKDLKNMMRF